MQLKVFLDKGIRGFVVVSDENDDLVFAQIKKACWHHVRWRPLSVLGKSLGSYALESLKFIDQHDINEIRMARFRHWSMFGGITTSATAALLEHYGQEFSWKVYALLGMTFALYAVSYRFYPLYLN